LTFILYDIIMLQMAKMGRPKLFGKGVKIMKTMIYLEKDTHLRLKHLAVDERASMSELIRRALDEYLKKHSTKGGRAK
jgi:Ribbon-helix-helix protein, copG family